jgi:cytochrome c-type biogenesis protein CcsB
LYVVALVLALLAGLGFTATLNRAAFWLICFTFLVHTFALVCRIYISDRPPVTNLYSSAVFIGWACVLFGIVLEALFRLGIGNIVAALSGFPTLLVSFALAADGDSIAVLQAVLDTQFWLATHVVCITLGYAATFLAGTLGLVYIARGLLVPWTARFCREMLLPAVENKVSAERHANWQSRLTPDVSPEYARELVRMIYGILCFAIIFSFIGTVLGGLWADDSWGRFWGWDPKENGALIIVLWNAVVLHARWDGMIRDRGLAILSLVGNVVTSWSWFGVNELGIGLHAYGFTEGRLQALGWFILSQLLIVAVAAMLPKRFWWNREKTAVA